MKAAIYARRSTDHQEASLGVQIDEARRYAASMGWTIDDAHVFVDDSLSRAEYKKRPALYALLNSAEEKRFGVIVIRDIDRLGGDTNRNGVILSDLIDHGIRVDEYLTRNTVKLDNAIAKFLAQAKNFAAEIEREKTSARTHEALKSKARKGLVVGGKCYGYKNIRKEDGSHYAIEESEATIVRQIFSLYRAGKGLKGIVRTLNETGVPSPWAQKRGTGSWSPSSVRPLLKRERYRGVLTWGLQEKGYRHGTKVRTPRAHGDEDIITVEVPELRIIDDELWFAVQARFASRSTEPKRGGPRHRHLLSGLGRCASCGGPISVHVSTVNNQRTLVYMCKWSKERGVCAETLRRPLASVNDAVTSWISDALSPELVMVIMGELRDDLEARQKETKKDLTSKEKEAAKLRREIDRLVSVLATSADKPDAVIRGIADRQARASALEAELAAAKLAPAELEASLARLEEGALRRISNLREELSGEGFTAREVVAALFPEGLKFRSIPAGGGRRFQIEGRAAVGSILATEGVVPNCASPGGPTPLGTAVRRWLDMDVAA